MRIIKHNMLMNPEQKTVNDFMRQTGMHPDGVDFQTTVSDMTDEMARGLNGEESSLEMIPTYIRVDPPVPAGTTVVLDAGGTNLRAAQVTFDAHGHPQIDNFSRHPMPGTQGAEVSPEEFFDTMAALIQPLLGSADKIGFCFSYPVEMFPDRDGRLIGWTKEVQAPGVVGMKVGEGLRDALRKRGAASPPEVILLNDTVATVLTGKVSGKDRRWGDWIGFILGTGSNSCYAELNSSIGKIAENEGRQIINCESGSFRSRFRGEADRILCQMTKRPEYHLLEKMLSGRYFGPLVTQTLLLAASGGLFSRSFTNALDGLSEVSTKDADNYLHSPTGADNALTALMKRHGNQSDAQRLWFLDNALLERAAKLTAANLAATVLKGQGGTGPLEPACITIDGTTYYRYHRFSHRVESYLRPFLESRNRYYETLQVSDAPLIGAAVASLTN